MARDLGYSLWPSGFGNIFLVAACPSVLHLFRFFAAGEVSIALVERASKPATPTFLSALRLRTHFGCGSAALYYTIANSSQPATILAGPESVGRKKIAQRVSAGKA